MNGIVNILKPPGMTSQDVVTDIRRITGVKRVGHCGTLDPGASGVLTVCVGKAARLFDYTADKRKRYRFEALFGVTSDTLDSYAKEFSYAPADVSFDALNAVLPQFVGEVAQTPPMYSALKLNGQKLCDAARSGKQLDLSEKTRVITIYSLCIAEKTGDNRFLLDVECSAGTYVRTLAMQLAESLGTIACVTFLLRTASARFGLCDCLTLDECKSRADSCGAQSLLSPVENALDFPDAFIDRIQARELIDGKGVVMHEADGLYRLFCQNRFVGVGECVSDVIKLKTFFSDREEFI